MQKKLLPLLGIAFVVAIVATGILYGLIAGKLGSSSGSRANRSIVVAAQDLQPGRVLKAEDVKLAPWGGETPRGAFTGVEQVSGMTVLEMVRATEPVTQPRLAAKDSAGAALAVPSGMRAVSIRATDSAGVVALLRPGHRVDVQVVRTRQGNDVELRTVLQNVAVLNLAPVEANAGRSGQGSVVTLLVKPAEAEALGLADSGARVRLALRNPVDGEKSPLGGLGIGNLFGRGDGGASGGGSRAAAPRPGARADNVSHRETPGGADPKIQLQVRIAGAASAALEELHARLVSASRGGLLQVSAFRPGWDLEKALLNFQGSRQLEVLAASNLTTGAKRQVSMQAGALWNASRPARGAEAPLAYGIRVQFLPSWAGDGKLRLRVQPEIASPQGEGVATRKIETEVELADGQSFLVSGLAEPGHAEVLWERLFPGRSLGSGNRELVVLVTPQMVRSAPRHPQTASLIEPR